MDNDFKKMKKLIKMMRNEGVLHMKQGEIEISLSPGALFPKNDVSSSNDSINVQTDFTDDALIDWSNIAAGIEASQ